MKPIIEQLWETDRLKLEMVAEQDGKAAHVEYDLMGSREQPGGYRESVSIRGTLPLPQARVLLGMRVRARVIIEEDLP